GTSTQISGWKPVTAGKTWNLTYTYDAKGNILSVSDGTNTTSYEYDIYDQLTRENNQGAGKTWVYAYDFGGNILSKTEYAYTTGAPGAALNTVVYGYADASWPDLLTSRGGKTVTSDAIGNMLTDGTWTYTWKHGRQLAAMTDGTTSVSYTYDAEGMRTGKTVGSTTTKYYYVGARLTDVTYGTDTLHIGYDEFGAESLTYNGTRYYYVKNAQGDVIGLVNGSGAVVAEYAYDAWGNILSIQVHQFIQFKTQPELDFKAYGQQ
ncbi:MAG: hypothetical protein PUA83_09545, partial [Clostridiales bacterium]|nr:hypothetical protein [Clostridiales bacterium]